MANTKTSSKHFKVDATLDNVDLVKAGSGVFLSVDTASVRHAPSPLGHAPDG